MTVVWLNCNLYYIEYKCNSGTDVYEDQINCCNFRIASKVHIKKPEHIDDILYD